MKIALFDKIANIKFKNPKIAKIIFGISVLIGIFFMAFKPPIDPDLFWHLKTGELIWTYQTFPQTDWYSYTMSGYQRAEFEWLSEVLMFLIWKISGFGGLTVFFTLVITATFGFFLPKSINGPFFVTHFLAMLGAFVSSLTFGARPQMFSLLGAALLFYIITRYKQNPKSQIFWLLPAIFLLWANLHGGFIYGIIFMAIFLGLEKFLIAQKKRRPDADWLKLYAPLDAAGWKNFFYSFAISLLLTFLNPYSWRVYQEIYKATVNTYDKNIIIEWLAPNFHTTEGLIFGFYVIFIFIILAMIKKIDLLSFALIPIFLFFAFQAGRNIPFFVIISLPFLVKSMEEFENIFSELLNKKFIAIALSGFLIIYLPLSAKSFDVIKTFNNNQELARQGEYPEKALQFLLSNPSYRDKNIFNNYGWGGYLIYNAKCQMTNDKKNSNQNQNAIVNLNSKNGKIECSPKVFIDGRMSYWQLPDRHILKDYIDASNIEDGWENILDKYRVEILFLDKKTSLAKALKFNNGWKNIHEDDLAVIYEKNE